MPSTDNLAASQRLLLTIAIPTYNRAKYLDLCLQRVTEEIDNLSEDLRRLVKVYVSNNCSTDDTEQVLSQYQSMKVGELEVVRNSENIGGEGNVAQCYTSATSTYVWVLGDDDVILPGKLQIVLDALIKRKVDILYVKGYSYSTSYLDEPEIGGGKSGIAEYSDALDFVRRTNVMLTFITALIIRGGVSDDLSSQVVSGSNLPQLSWVLPLLRDGKLFAIIEDRIFAAKSANSGGYGLIEVFAENLQRISKAILKDQPELIRAIENGTIVNFFPGFILESRSGSSKFHDKNVADGLKQAFGGNWRYFIFLAPLIAMPLYLSRCYYFLIRLLRLFIGHLLI